MGWFTGFSLKNTAAIVIVVLLVTLGGIYSASGLKQETMPDVSIPIVAVITPYPGASPGDVHDDLTKPVEDALAGVSGIQHVNSTSSENVSVVIANFGYSEDMDAAKRAVQDAVAKIKLPTGAMDPQISRISFGSFPILKIAIANGKIPADRLHRAIDDQVTPKLSGLEGVGSVQVSGGAAKGIIVRLKPDELADHNLTAAQVMQQIQANNLSFPVGSVDMRDKTKPVRVSGDLATLEALKRLEIPLQPNMSDVLKKAFAGIGTGFEALGGALGKLGSAVGGLGQAMGGIGQGLGAQIGLTGAISDIQIQTLQAKMGLAAAQGVFANPMSTPQQKTEASMTVARLTPVIAGMEAATVKLKAQLAGIQKAMMQGGASGGSGGSGSSGGSSGSGSSGGSLSSSSGSSVDTAIKHVHLEDVAEVTIGIPTAEAYTRTDGQPSVLLEIVKSQDGNTVDVADRVKKELGALVPRLPKGSTVNYVYDGSVQVTTSVNGMVREGLLGALFAFLVILLFLRNVRATVIAVVSIPLSILIAMVFLARAGITLNVMTLGGLTVAIGRVVDDSIVVIENIFRRMKEAGGGSVELIREATAEVSSAITSSTLTTVAVFVPLGLVSGIVGKVFQPFALTVGLSLLASLLVAVTVVPVIARFTLLGARFRVHEEGAGIVILAYQRLLRWSLDHKAVVFATAGLMLAGSIALMPIVGTGFMPQTSERYIAINVEYPEGTNVKTTNALAARVEKLVAKDPIVKTYQTAVSASQNNLTASSGSPRGSNQAQVFMRLSDNASVFPTVMRYRAALASYAPKGVIKVADAGNRSMGGSSNSLELDVIGEDVGAVKKAAAQLTAELQTVKGLGEVSNNLGKSKPEILVDVSQSRAADKALSAAQVGAAMRQLLSDQAIGQMTVKGQKLDIRFGLKLDPVRKLADLRRVAIQTPTGANVELGDIAKVSQVAGPVSIYTRDGNQYAVVNAEIVDKNAGKVTSEVKRVVAGATLPGGITTQLGGTAQMMSESFTQLGLAMLVAVGAVYLVMILAFGEATAPLAILFALPLAIIGGIFGLFAVRQPLNMPAMIGALMLIGIVVTNAIVLIDRVQKKRREGLSMREALVEAGTVRMRPILMTAIATICALLPLASGLSEGALISQSLAAIVIGGLTTSTLLTLVVVPAAFEMLEGLFHREERAPAGSAAA
jgi:multidrug efflux pump subunit AcrB